MCPPLTKGVEIDCKGVMEQEIGLRGKREKDDKGGGSD